MRLTHRRKPAVLRSRQTPSLYPVEWSPSSRRPAVRRSDEHAGDVPLYDQRHRVDLIGRVAGPFMDALNCLD